MYASTLGIITQYANVKDPFAFAALGLEKIEDLTEEWIRQNQDVKAPKYLNVVYCAVKTWCKINGLIKSRKMFKEIEFDKSSAKQEALTISNLETKNVKDMFTVGDLGDKVDTGLFGLMGLRPVLIPQMNVKHIHERSYVLENGKLKFTRKPAILIVTRLTETGERRRGNKGNITFMTFIPTVLCELIETRLNNLGAPVTPETRLAESENEDAVYFKIKRLYKKIGFQGKPYLLRSYADTILDRITRDYNDEDFKEFLMGHKGKISAVYQIKGISEEVETKYREMYAYSCDKWINENIFGMVSREEVERAKILNAMAQQLGVKPEALESALKLLNVGKITFTQYQEHITKLTKEVQDQRIRSEFERMFNEAMNKRTNARNAQV